MTDSHIACRAEHGPIEDRVVAAKITPPETIGHGFRTYQRMTVEIAGAGGAALRQERDILRVGKVVAVLAYDPQARCVVLIRQFRLAAHLANGRGEIVELAAGIVEPGETDEAAALRECREEIGTAPRALLPVLTFMPSPGVTDETATLFLAIVDSREVPAEAGEPGEGEHTRPFLVSFEAVQEALATPLPGTIGNAYVLTALQWLVLNRERADAFARTHG